MLIAHWARAVGGEIRNKENNNNTMPNNNFTLEKAMV